jgi:hypothetical protein
MSSPINAQQFSAPHPYTTPKTTVSLGGKITCCIREIAIFIFNRLIKPFFKNLGHGLINTYKHLRERIHNSYASSLHAPLPSSLQPYQTKIENTIMQEFKNLNPENTEHNALLRKLVYLDLLQTNYSSPTLNQDIGLNPEERKVCQTLHSISKSVHKLKGFYPRRNQLLSTLLFLEGKETSLAQIRTGQGKTLIAAMTAIARVELYSEQACILTTTEPLAYSGMTEMLPLYKEHGLSVGYFNGAAYVGSSLPKKVFDVTYSTSFALESDKVAKKKKTRTLLPFWNTPKETLEGIILNFKKSKNRECKQFIAPSEGLIKQYEELPNLENEEKIKTQIKGLKERYPGLKQHFRGLCLIVDECDSVLYDHAGSRIQSTIPMPYCDEINKTSQEIAREVSDFYKRSPRPTNVEIQRIKQNIQKSIEEFLKTVSSPFLKEYIMAELPSWIDGAIEVMKPDDPNWQNGVKYITSPSISEELRGVFLSLKDLYQTLSSPSKTQLQSVLKKGLDFFDTLETLRKDPNKKLPRGFILSLKRYLPLLYRNLNLSGSSAQNIKTSVCELYTRIEKIEETISEKSLRDLLVNNHIRYIETETSQIIDNMKFSDMIHFFLEYKEFHGKTLSKPTTALDLQSQLDVICDADCLVGFTGSLPDKESSLEEYTHFKKLLENVYGKNNQSAKLAIVPDFTPSKMCESPPTQLRTTYEWKKALLSEIQQRKANQAILLVCKNPKEANELKEFLEKQSVPAKASYVRKEDKEVIDATYRKGDIVITTALGARGTDWHVKAEKGFHVICSYPPRDPRTKTQIKGRAARSGQEGSYIEISLFERQRKKSKSEEVDFAIMQANYSDLFSSFYRIFKESLGENKKLQDDLILWMSQSRVRKQFIEAIEHKAKNKLSPNKPLDLLLENFFKQFIQTSSSRSTSKLKIQISFWTEVKRWSQRTALQ